MNICHMDICRHVQAFGSSVQGVDPTSLAVINDVPLGEFGHCGPIIDMSLDGERLWAVIDGKLTTEGPLEIPTSITTVTTHSGLLTGIAQPIPGPLPSHTVPESDY